MEKEKKEIHYTESIVHLLEQAVTYFKINGAQFFNELKIGITIDQFVALDAIYCNDDICQRDLSKLILKDRSILVEFLISLKKKDLSSAKLRQKASVWSRKFI